MTREQSKIILGLVAEFGARSATSSDDGWTDLLVGLSQLIEADGLVVQPPPARISGMPDSRTSWGAHLTDSRLKGLVSTVRHAPPGTVSNIRDARSGSCLIVVEYRRIILFHRQPGAAGFAADRAAIAAAVVSACAAVRLRAPGLPARLESIPARLRQVLRGLLSGLSEKEIAYGLGISRHTVHAYVTSLYRTARVNSRFELITLCVRSGPQVESILQAEFFAAVQDEDGKVPHGHIDPGQQIIPSTGPVPSVDRSIGDVRLSDHEPTGKLLEPIGRFANHRTRRKTHGSRIIPSRRAR
jgi:DNA-binding CsgD family transcriptional regulator